MKCFICYKIAYIEKFSRFQNFEVELLVMKSEAIEVPTVLRKKISDRRNLMNDDEEYDIVWAELLERLKQRVPGVIETKEIPNKRVNAIRKSVQSERKLAARFTTG